MHALSIVLSVLSIIPLLVSLDHLRYGLLIFHAIRYIFTIKRIDWIVADCMPNVVQLGEPILVLEDLVQDVEQSVCLQVLAEVLEES